MFKLMLGATRAPLVLTHASHINLLLHSCQAGDRRQGKPDLPA